MKHILSTSEIIGVYSRGQEEYEVCATAEANYKDDASQLNIELDCFIRPVDIRVKEQHLPEDWLPKRQALNESVSRGEASDLARDAFHRWVVRVRQSVPVPLHGKPQPKQSYAT